MKKSLVLIFIFISSAFSNENTYSIFTQYTDKNFQNSKQKGDGKAYLLGFSAKQDKNSYKAVFNNMKVNTFQPPLKEDLDVKKYSANYKRQISNSLSLGFSALYIDDNIAASDNGKIYGALATYKLPKKIALDLGAFYGDYEKFSTKQVDFKISKPMKINDIKFKFYTGAKYINLDDKNSSNFTKNAKDSYFSPFIGFNSMYKGYVFTAKKFFSKRAFSVMNDGLGVQHHAMEFKEAYAFVLGKQFKNIGVFGRYSYEEAKELPMQNDDVKHTTASLILKYKF